MNNNNNTIEDNTCPKVLNLQKKIKNKYLENPDCQIFIFGKKEHPEVIGLLGQTNNSAIVISCLKEIENIDIKFPFYLFSQTTANYNEYSEIQEYLSSFIENNDEPENYFFNTICSSVKNRIPQIKEFCKKHDLIIFVSDKESSNGEMLFNECKKSNENSHRVASRDELKEEWFENIQNIGISGATSTPLWLMEEIKQYIEQRLAKV